MKRNQKYLLLLAAFIASAFILGQLIQQPLPEQPTGEEEPYPTAPPTVPTPPPVLPTPTPPILPTPPPDEPEPTPPPITEAEITIRALDQYDTPVPGAIYVDYRLMGTTIATFTADVGTTYRASFGGVNDYERPADILFKVNSDGKLDDDTTEIKAVYVLQKPPAGKVKLSVKVVVQTMTFTVPLEDAEVEIKALGLSEKTNAQGEATFFVAANHGETRIDVYHPAQGSTAGLVTVGSTDVSTTIYYVTGDLTVTDLQSQAVIPLVLIIGGLATYLLLRKKRLPNI